MTKLGRMTGLLALLLSGCGGSAGTAPVAPSGDDAKPILRAALDAWKAGDPKSLASRTPPIRFTDPDQAAGGKLDDFTIGETSTVAGHTLDIPVTITIRDRRGKVRTSSAVYQVVREPELAVIRNDP